MKQKKFISVYGNRGEFLVFFWNENKLRLLHEERREEWIE